MLQAHLVEAHLIGWCSPSVLRLSPFLRSLEAQASRDPNPSHSLHTLLALATLPCPSYSELLVAGMALEVLVGQHPVPLFNVSTVFLAPYCPCMAFLPLPALLVLLRVCQLADLPQPTVQALSACLAQRYASLPPAQFEAEIATPCPHWAALARDWWSARFGPRQPGSSAAVPDPPDWEPPPMCHCCSAHTSPLQVSGDLPPSLTLGLAQGAPAAEYFARGRLPPGASQPPTPCLLALAAAFGHSAWLGKVWPSALQAMVAMAKTLGGSPAAHYSALLALLAKEGRGSAFLTYLCCLQLWSLAHTCPSRHTALAVATVVGALQAHPGDACIALNGCGAVGALTEEQPTAPGLGAALLAGLPTLAAVLLSPCLPAPVTCNAAIWLSCGKVGSQPALLAGLLAAGTGAVPRLVELLQWHHMPQAQLRALRALFTLCSSAALAVLDAGALPPLLRLLDSSIARVREHAVMLLGRLADSSEEARTAALAAGVLSPLLRTLQPFATAAFVRYGAEAVASLMPSQRSRHLRWPGRRLRPRCCHVWQHC